MKKQRTPKKLELRKETLALLVGGYARDRTIIDTVYSTSPYGCEPPSHTCQSNCVGCPV